MLLTIIYKDNVIVVPGFIAIRAGSYNRLCVELTLACPKRYENIFYHILFYRKRVVLCALKGLKRHILQEYDLSVDAPKICKFQILDTKRAQGIIKLSVFLPLLKCKEVNYWFIISLHRPVIGHTCNSCDM